MKSVLFDVDGTLLNTHEFIVSAYEHALQSIGRPISRTEADAYFKVGKSLRDTYKYMLPDEDADLLVRRHHEYQRHRFHLIHPFEGASKTLQKIKQVGFKLAAVTNRSRDSAIPSLEQNMLIDYFDAVVCPEDTLHAKPHPSHLQSALRLLERDPEHSWMVGDSAVDIAAAHSASVRSIGISHFGDDSIKKHRPDHVVYSLEEILPIVFSR